MTATQDPFAHHPELQGKITDPMTSAFRSLRVENVIARHPELKLLREHFHSDEDREQNRAAALKDHPEEDLWIFGYGSLMWDPGFRFAEVRRAQVHDHARRFILIEMLGGRGTREAPGLIAALDRGAGCEGLAFRIPRDLIDEETEILWRREMVAPGYIPSFITAMVEDGPRTVLTFVADHAAEHVRPGISRAEQLDCLINGRGFLGTSLGYLENIVAQFDVLGIVDPDCTALLQDAQALARRKGDEG